MSMTVSISCDGCDLTEETSTSFEAGTNEIEGVLEDGWAHSNTDDFCPDCVRKGRAE
ncbi:hypothetical protein IV500_04880 [Paeniglutamicibacter antarcticus]|uniref:Uncharacterized protein n=1 Tax=Arthrobacter terrae TaxID=2935737 RepID=A0A931CI53_9MICC|nr:hypothetical protein [Arthrobacter terrae]MBG0738753.1 hypothetical protein [Arthrobacter terrae]